MGYLFSEKEQEELDECISFWSDLMRVDTEKNKMDRIKIIRHHIKNGNFKKYFNGRRGAIREIMLILWR